MIPDPPTNPDPFGLRCSDPDGWPGRVVSYHRGHRGQGVWVLWDDTVDGRPTWHPCKAVAIHRPAPERTLARPEDVAWRPL